MGNVWLRHQLEKRTIDNTASYGFEGQQLLAKIVSVYDGDTCSAAVRINGFYQIIKVRCYGYDSPEMRPSKKDANRDAEIALAKEAKAALERMVLNKIVQLKMHGFDKYGRFLGTIYCRRFWRMIDVNAAMVAGGHGVPYLGGTKQNSNTDIAKNTI